jgi:hypothetical protein
MERGKMLCCTSAAKLNFVRKLVAFSCSQIRESLSLPAQLIHDDDNEDISKKGGRILLLSVGFQDHGWGQQSHAEPDRQSKAQD